jgi:pimeloyl-ACP methyl ester carboxylesterase
MTTMEVPMSELGYDAAGAGDPALLFLHGWCGDRSFFSPEFDHFSATQRVVSVDLTGYGASAVRSNYEVESFASGVTVVARSVDFGRGVVVGHGLGAMVALAHAWYAPEHVGAVVMIDPPPFGRDAWERITTEVIPSNGPRRSR